MKTSTENEILDAVARGDLARVSELRNRLVGERIAPERREVARFAWRRVQELKQQNERAWLEWKAATSGIPDAIEARWIQEFEAELHASDPSEPN